MGLKQIHRGIVRVARWRVKESFLLSFLQDETVDAIRFYSTRIWRSLLHALFNRNAYRSLIQANHPFSWSDKISPLPILIIGFYNASHPEREKDEKMMAGSNRYGFSQPIPV
jgi:hypothetical protein